MWLYNKPIPLKLFKQPGRNKLNKFNEYRPLVKAFKLALITGASMAAMSTTALYAANDNKADKEENLVTITGSRIKRSEAEGPSPVITFTREDMETQGYSTLQDAMDSLVQNSGGSTDQSFTFGFVPGASSIDLRGFGNGRSLTLVDGKRLPVYPVANSGTDNFVDLSAIPSTMIERVEILIDGASAIYGSDAVSGVINIITRKDIEGVELTYKKGMTSDGGYDNDKVSIVAGAVGEKTSVNFMAEYQHNEQILASERDYAASDVANPRGVYSSGGASFWALSPNLSAAEIIPYPLCGDQNDALGSRVIDQGPGNWCAYNRTQHRQLFPENKRIALTSRVDHELTPDLNVYMRIGFSSYQTNTQLEPNFYGGWWTGTQPGDNYTTVADSAVGTILTGIDFGNLADGSPDYMWGLVPIGAANNPTTGTANEREGFFRRRLFEYGNRRSDIKNDGINGIVGLEGTFDNAAYEWEASLGYNKTRLTIQRPNIINSVFNNAVTNGLDLFQIIPQSVIDRTSFLSLRNSASNNVLADFIVTGDTPLELDGGAVAFAVFADYERQWFFNTADPITLAGDAFDGGSAGAGAREHSGIGFEVNFPIIDGLDVDIAVRHDNYDDASDVGSAVSPRLAISYRPIDTLLLRFTAGESFRAPDLQRLFGATTNAYTTVNDPRFCLDTSQPNTPQPVGSANCDGGPWQQQSINVTTGSNIALEEEEGTNFNIGAVWDITDEWNLTIDYYDVELENIVSVPTSQFLVNQCLTPGGAGNFCEQVNINAQNLIGGVSATAQNLSFQAINGVDTTLRYKLETEEVGQFDFTLEYSWIDSLITQLDETRPKVENLGLATLPDNRANFTVDWTNGDWGATFRYAYTGEMCGVNGGGAPDGSCLPEEFIDTYSIINMSIRYDVGDYGRFSLGINNVANKDPADDPTNNNWPWFFNNGGFSNPIGREISVTYTIEF